MFNDDQRSHMKHLSGLPRDRKCKCGWNLKGDCYGPECAAETAAVKAAKENTTDQQDAMAGWGPT